ncbi:MAG: hypothetical protein HDS59_00885 [Barnesiella sp.]|nr:hypothetical protein [Barnesiella sp.]
MAKNIESHSIASSRLRERGLCVPQPALTLGWGYPQVRSYGAEFNTSGVGWTGLRSGHVNVPGNNNQKPSGLTAVGVQPPVSSCGATLRLKTFITTD